MLALPVSRKGRVIIINVTLCTGELQSSVVLWPWELVVAAKSRHFQLPAVKHLSCHCYQMHATGLSWRRETIISLLALPFEFKLHLNNELPY